MPGRLTTETERIVVKEIAGTNQRTGDEGAGLKGIG